jgi:2-dehydro-3-deoxyphosphogluconate aldolase/(4S)-4-hydroxy-2-oxoglutarate aldolase
LSTPIAEPASTAPADRPHAVLDQIAAAGAFGILRAADASRFPAVTRVLWEAGIRSVEFTLTSRGALEALRIAAAELPEGASIGAGTVLTVEDADAAVQAGAQYLVTPTFDAGVVRHARDRHVPIISGAMTPTEILEAWRAGATAVKVFPAGTLGGPAYLAAVRGPLPGVPMVPTGGIEVDEAGGYLRAGAVAVGIGGPLLGDAATPDGDLGALRDRAERLLASVREARQVA